MALMSFPEHSVWTAVFTAGPKAIQVMVGSRPLHTDHTRRTITKISQDLTAVVGLQPQRKGCPHHNRDHRSA